MDKQQRIDELEARIRKLERQKGALQEWENGITPLESFTDSAKIRVFNELYMQARDYLQEYVSAGREPKDSKYWFYEAVLDKMLGEKVWAIMGQI